MFIMVLRIRVVVVRHLTSLIPWRDSTLVAWVCLVFLSFQLQKTQNHHSRWATRPAPDAIFIPKITREGGAGFGPTRVGGAGFGPRRVGGAGFSPTAPQS